LLNLLLTLLKSLNSETRSWAVCIIRNCYFQTKIDLNYDGVVFTIDVTNIEIKIKKTLKNVKKRDKNKKNVCKR